MSWGGGGLVTTDTTQNHCVTALTTMSHISKGGRVLQAHPKLGVGSCTNIGTVVPMGCRSACATSSMSAQSTWISTTQVLWLWPKTGLKRRVDGLEPLGAFLPGFLVCGTKLLFCVSYHIALYVISSRLQTTSNDKGSQTKTRLHQCSKLNNGMTSMHQLHQLQNKTAWAALGARKCSNPTTNMLPL